MQSTISPHPLLRFIFPPTNKMEKILRRCSWCIFKAFIPVFLWNFLRFYFLSFIFFPISLIFQLCLRIENLPPPPPPNILHNIYPWHWWLVEYTTKQRTLYLFYALESPCRCHLPRKVFWYISRPHSLLRILGRDIILSAAPFKK